MPTQIIDNPKQWQATAKRLGYHVTRRAHATCVEYDAWDPCVGETDRLRHRGTLIEFNSPETAPSGYLFAEVA